MLIILIAFSLRVYKINSYPPSISWDEAAVSYNGYNLFTFGRDEYGKFMPLYFQSFGDDKHPVHVYLTAPFVKLFGLNEFATRFPAALFGVFNVILVFFLTNLLFKKPLIGLVAAAFFAISPQNIHFSRFNHEANFTLFFFMLGLYLFYLAIYKKITILPFSIISFVISFFAYHPSKILVPIILLILLIFYIKKIISDKKSLIMSLFIIIFAFLLIIFNPQLLGLSRVNQTSINIDTIKKTDLFKITKNEFLGRINLYLVQYSWHFSPTYLFISGDKNPRLSSQSTGEFYKIDAIFILAGVIFLIYRRSKVGFVILIWALLSPIPSSLTAEAPHSARAMYMMGSLNIIAALGFYALISIFKYRLIKLAISVVCFVILGMGLFNYLSYYFGEYSKRYAIEWQYGMKEIVEFVKTHKDYSQIYMTDIRSQPYIFFLYYLNTPLPEYLNGVVYNKEESKSFNAVSSFDQIYILENGEQNRREFYFGGWDIVESLPQEGRLYVISSSQYDGLRYKSTLDIKKIIYYPNGTEAFYLVSIL